MSDRVTKGDAAMALGAYLTVLWAHAYLPDAASFALVMASMATVMATYLLVVTGRRDDTRPRRCSVDFPGPVTVPFTQFDPVGMRMPIDDNLVGRLRVIEAELHALEDQRVSEQALSVSTPMIFRPEAGR